MGSIRLVRHGQASFGAADYDVLSEVGHAQADVLRDHWAASPPPPGWAVSGTLRRQVDTARAVLDGLEVPEPVRDAGWNEFDQESLLPVAPEERGSLGTAEVQARLNVALTDWMDGVGAGHAETFAEFSARVLGAFEEAARHAGPGQVASVFSSAGPIALVVSHLLNGDASLFRHLNDVLVNCSVTTVIVGGTGPRLLSFNDHGHLPRDRVTFR